MMQTEKDFEKAVRAYLLDSPEMSETDRRTSEVIGIPAAVLMERAALATREAIEADPVCSTVPANRRYTVIVAGRGNNGADGLALARLLTDHGFPVAVLMLCGPLKEGSLCRLQADILEEYGIPVREFDDISAKEEMLKRPLLIVDAIAGTGLDGALGGDAQKAAEWIAACRDKNASTVVSIDIPSGVCASDGSVRGTAVRADITVTYGFYKAGHFLMPGGTYCGRVMLYDIGINERAFKGVPKRFTYRGISAAHLLPARPVDGNKGTFGKILVAAGSRQVCGAAVLCAKAALKSGAGMVRIFTHKLNRDAVSSCLPEALATYYDDENEAEMEALLKEAVRWADVCAAGPGISVTDTGKKILSGILSSYGDLKAMVLDADAVRIAGNDDRIRNMIREASGHIPLVMTPHLAEYSALCGLQTESLKDHGMLVSSLKEQTGKLGCTIVCKDHRTIVFDQREPSYYINTSGNDAMATAGSGDVLTGITAALCAVMGPGFDAACAAVYLHGLAGEKASLKYGRGLTAGDIIDGIPDLLV